MAENESMEGKDLAKEEQKSFRERLKVQITKLKIGKKNKQNQNEEQQEEEIDDEKPELEENDKEKQEKKKEEIAKKYNVNAKYVIHISKDEKLTENEKFQDLVDWSKEYNDVYFIPGEDLYTYKAIGEKKGKQEEIQQATTKMVDGKNPSVTVKRIDGEQITEVKPYAMYEIDKDTSVAIVINEYGEREALYCRVQAGQKREFWGEVIPEKSGKNVLQQNIETREVMDHKYNSGYDLDNKAKALDRQDDLEKRGLPSEKKGVQVDEIKGNHKQNVTKNIEEIEKELMTRDGIVDKLTVPPGYYENKAKKVLSIMEANENITYEQAIEQVEEQAKREKGGRALGEQPKDPRIK